MIIYNEREMSSDFVKDNKIIEINSPIKDISDAIELIRTEASKENPDLSSFSIHAYQYSDEPFQAYISGSPIMETRNNVFDAILSDTEYESLSDDADVYERPDPFVQFEKIMFNQKSDLTFKEVPVSAKELLDDMMGSYGILPTLWGEAKPVKELKSLSTSGEKLMRRFKGEKWRVSKFNAAPPIAWIEFYQNLTPYEKRIVTDGRVHPAKVAQIANFIKTNAKDMLLTKEMVDYLIQTSAEKETRVIAKDVAEHFISGFATKYKDTVDLATEVFKEKYHGFAPRVLNEYMQGALAARGINPQNATRNQIEEIADKFSRQNVQKVAKYKNPVLLALSEKLDCGKMKDNVLLAIGTNVPVDKLNALFSKGFPEWLNEHADVTPNDVLKIIEKISEVDKIDPAISAKDLISMIENRRGYEDCKRFEERSIYKQVGYKFENNELAIKGRHIVAKQGNLTMRMLAPDDYKNFTIGIDTHCCQRYGDAGESCVYKYTSDPFAGAVVIERGDKVIAQGFVWVDVAADTFVFDNVELDNDREVQQFTGLFAAYAKALPYANVHIGTGYNQGMNGWGQKVLFDKKNPISAIMPTTIDGRTNITSWGDGNCYSDYHVSGGSVARVIKHMGVMKLPEVQGIQVETAPDEPTRWDELAKPDLCFMLNDWHKTPEERLEIARSFRENPTEALQMEIVQRTPVAITSLEHPCEMAQKYILEHYPEMIHNIKNPCAEIQAELIRQDPSYITSIENPSNEMIINVLERDGMMLEHIPNPSVDACLAAVTQNGYARKFVPQDKITDEINKTAVMSQPKIIVDIENPSDEVIRTALTKDPNVISIMDQPSEFAQRYAVSLRPSLINQIDEPCYEAVRDAVAHNGLMIRNFQRQYPELREVALRQNGYAAGCLKNLTEEEVRIAINQNRNAVSAIKDKDLVAQIVSSATRRPEIHEVLDFDPEIS